MNWTIVLAVVLLFFASWCIAMALMLRGARLAAKKAVDDIVRIDMIAHHNLQLTRIGATTAWGVVCNNVLLALNNDIRVAIDEAVDMLKIDEVPK